MYIYIYIYTYMPKRRDNALLLGRRVDGSARSTWGIEYRSRIEDIRLVVLRTTLTDVGNSLDVRNKTYNTHAHIVTSTVFINARLY